MSSGVASTDHIETDSAAQCSPAGALMRDRHTKTRGSWTADGKAPQPRPAMVGP